MLCFFVSTGLWQKCFCSQVTELANQLVPGRNQIPLAYKTVYLYTAEYRFTPQTTWSTRTVSTDAGVSGLNGKHLLWRPAFLWYKLLTPRHVYAKRSSLWCANAGKARVCTRWDQKGDSYQGPTLQSILHPPSEECTLSCRHIEDATVQPRLLRGVWKYRRFLHCGGFLSAEANCCEAPGSWVKLWKTDR